MEVHNHLQGECLFVHVDSVNQLPATVVLKTGRTFTKIFLDKISIRHATPGLAMPLFVNLEVSMNGQYLDTKMLRSYVDGKDTGKGVPIPLQMGQPQTNIIFPAPWQIFQQETPTSAQSLVVDLTYQGTQWKQSEYAIWFHFE